MKLGELLEGVQVSKMFETTYGHSAITHEVHVHQLQYDSRKIQRGDCFVAIRGSGTDGHRFLESAIGNGASVVVLEQDSALSDYYFLHSGVVKVVVPDSRKALAVMSANYYHHPSRRLSLVGVTGTNGKTTTTHLIKAILEAAGQRVGLLGTIEYRIGDDVIPATHTTPESLELNELLARMATSGCQSVSMEVSSHALHQSRVYGLEYDAAVFTNLTQDHLDYHGSMEEYFKAKKVLFDSLDSDAVAVTNTDDPWGIQIVASSRGRTISYGVAEGADVRATDIRLSLDGTSCSVWFRNQQTRLTTPLVGRFNVYNVLAAYSTGLALGHAPDRLAMGIRNLKNVRGRFERIASPKGWTAIIDYADTPDALEKCLRTIHDVLPQERRGRIITVFGAGGDRDKTKRPLMGSVAGKWSDVIMVTSDNPRTEVPQQIIDEIVAGIPRGAQVTMEVDRRTAIHSALRQAQTGDVVLVAGKGHEDYQVIGKEKIHFSDREIVEEFHSRMKLTVNDIRALPHLQAFGFERAKDLVLTGVSTDSRTIQAGDLFIPLRGDTFDGHNFITKAVEAGAGAIIAESKWVEANQILFSSLNAPRLVVEDTIRTFGRLANAHRKKFKIPVIVIGGSNGKTTTKEMVSAVLRTKFRILNTEGNLNNHVGVPRTMLRLEKEHQVAVLEIGTNHFGEIDYLCSIVEPTHVLITNVGREHLEFFGSLDGVAKAEGEAFQWLRQHRRTTGIGFVNQDDGHLKKQSKGIHKAITYGFGKGTASVKGKVQSINENACVQLEVRQRAKKPFRVQLSVPGNHNAFNALAAATVGLTLKVPVKRIQQALSSVSSASKRMQVLKLDSVIVLNDTYNSNPDSVMAALGVLGSIGTPGKKIAVLADMLELGKNSIDEHKRIGEAVTTSGVKYLLTYGPLSRFTHDGAAMAEKSHYEQKAALSEFLFSLLSPGDVVLIKGSRGMRMEEVVAFITERFKTSKATPDQAA